MKKKEPKKKRVYDDDDGRTIADMSGVGTPLSPLSSGTDPRRAREEGQKKEDEEDLQLTHREKRAIAGGALLAALLVGGVFIVGCLLFLLFCVFVWFR
jgi:hypothetical protein